MVRHHGLRPPAFLDKAGFLGPRLFAAHCRYVDAADIALLGRTRTIVTHQATMAANRGVIPPIAKLRAAGCPIANGTDNNTNDLFEVMRVALLTERISRDDAFPRACGRSRRTCSRTRPPAEHGRCVRAPIGSLEVGKKADLIVVVTRRAHLVPAGRIVSAAIHNGHPSDIECDGRRPVHDARPQGPDDGRGARRRRGRHGRTADLEAGPRRRPACRHRMPVSRSKSTRTACFDAIVKGLGVARTRLGARPFASSTYSPGGNDTR